MESRFKDRSLKIIGVDSSGAVRQLLNEVMKSLGFENFQAMASVQDALQSMEVESVDWLILPLMADQEVNAIHILRLLSLYPELKNIRITFFLEEEERYCLPDAFGLGLLSWLSKPYNKDSLTKELESFLSNFENENWDSTRLAVSYCYDYLMQEKLHESALELINGFLDLYPADPTALIKLSRPLYELNRKSEANAALTQALLVDESLESEVQALRSELFGASDDDIEEEVEEPRNLLGIENCIIIDSDEQASAQIKELLTELGVKEILQFSDGESAWIWLQENESPAVIFHEWRIPKLTGPYFIQRVRGKFPCIPLIAVSALIREEDMPLIIEMGISTVVSKPVVKTDFIKAVVHVIRQERMPTDVEFLERKIRQNIIANNSDEISSLMEKYMSMAEIPVRRKMKMEAELAYYEEDYEKSRNLAVEALKGGSDSVQVLNLLGKSLMQMQDYEAALKCFEKAQVMSPKNIHRLCVIAEVSS
ncbi:MAG: response regulator [Bdellovibrionota bacterium]